MGRSFAGADDKSCLGSWPERAGLAQRPISAPIWSYWDELLSPVTYEGQEFDTVVPAPGPLGSRGI